ncbi:MAG: macro domain-containing protein [Deltaproteobacteria bacterium]|jgi:O-acetyl-ADP-ribose deacetylase (regulator of RNase III)|nr:macro domain-containing protein [Deltaproteobacteria bacterium]
MPLSVVSADITQLKVDAVANAANGALAPGGGVCGAIFRGAGPKLIKACARLSPLPTGKAAITYGYDLPATYVIHAVGPVWRGGASGESADLRGAYAAALELAVDHDCRSVAFPLISAGIYGYPKDLAFHEAVAAIGAFLRAAREIDVILSVFPKAPLGLTPELKKEIAAFGETAAASLRANGPAPLDGAPPKSFKEILIGHARARDLAPEALARRANLLESAVRETLESEEGSPPPAKERLISLCLGLELNLRESLALLAAAGYLWDWGRTRERIVAYFLANGPRDVFGADEALYASGEEFLPVA